MLEDVAKMLADPVEMKERSKTWVACVGIACMDVFAWAYGRLA